MKARNRRGVLCLLLGCMIVAACGAAPQQDVGDTDAGEPADEIAWVKKVMVHGVPILATNTTGDDKLLHAAGVLAQYLDNDEDGEVDNPKIHQAMLDTGGTIVMTGTQDEAHGGRFDGPPDEYPEGAWYTYDDETCDYGCMAAEYIYWVYTSFIGAQDFPGRLDDIGHEWPLNTREKVKEGEPVLFEVLSRPEYSLATVIPDGNYEGAPLVIEPYEFPGE